MVVAVVVAGSEQTEGCFGRVPRPKIVIQRPQPPKPPKPPKPPAPTRPPGPRATRNPRTRGTGTVSPTTPPHDQKMDSIDGIQVINEKTQGDAVSVGSKSVSTKSISAKSISSNDLSLADDPLYPKLKNNLNKDPDAIASAPPASPSRSQTDLTASQPNLAGQPPKKNSLKKTFVQASVYFGASTASGLISSAPFLALQGQSTGYDAADAAPAMAANTIRRQPYTQPNLPPPQPQPSWPNNQPPLPKYSDPVVVPPKKNLPPKVINVDTPPATVGPKVKPIPKKVVTQKPTPVTVVAQADPPVTPLPRYNIRSPLPRFQQILPACKAHPLRCAAISTVVSAFTAAGATLSIRDLVDYDPDDRSAMATWMYNKLDDLCTAFGISRQELENVLSKFNPQVTLAHIFSHALRDTQAFRKRHNMPLRFQYPKEDANLGLSKVQFVMMLLSTQGVALYNYVSETIAIMEVKEPHLFDEPLE